jgi:hypothetical protein
MTPASSTYFIYSCFISFGVLFPYTLTDICPNDFTWGITLYLSPWCPSMNDKLEAHLPNTLFTEGCSKGHGKEKALIRSSGPACEAKTPLTQRGGVGNLANQMEILPFFSCLFVSGSHIKAFGAS